MNEKCDNPVENTVLPVVVVQTQDPQNGFWITQQEFVDDGTEPDYTIAKGKLRKQARLAAIPLYFTAAIPSPTFVRQVVRIAEVWSSATNEIWRNGKWL